MIISMFKGDTKTIEVTAKNQDGIAVDITGASIKFTVKTNATDTDAQAKFQKTTTLGITITDATNGKFEIAISPSDTSGLSAGEFVFDIQLNISGAIFTIAKDIFLLKQDVTVAV